MLNAYMVDDIKITQHQDNDDWGEPLPEIEIKVKGYVQWKTRLIRNINGEEVDSSIMIRVRQSSVDGSLSRPLSHEDRVNSINGDEIDRAILKINKPKAFSNPHYEIYLA